MMTWGVPALLQRSEIVQYWCESQAPVVRLISAEVPGYIFDGRDEIPSCCLLAQQIAHHLVGHALADDRSILTAGYVTRVPLTRANGVSE
jgi:hypothetical protein